MKTKYLYTGGYGNKISCFAWHDKALVHRFDTACLNASFLAMHPTKSVLYAVTETGQGACVTAFEKDEQTGVLTFCNVVSLEGAGLCHLVASEKAVYAAAYNSGQFFSIAILPDGSLGQCMNEICHVGSGEHKRQQSSHAHQVVLDPQHENVIAVDLGTNKLYTYPILEDGSLLAHAKYACVLPAGEGPRHMVFADNGKDAYLITELANKVFHLVYADGVFVIEDSMALLNTIQAGDIGAEIDFVPHTNLLYASVRGVNQLFVLSTEKNSGALSLLYQCDSNGNSPRMFSFSEDGEYLFVAHQLSGTVNVFDVDITTKLPKNCCYTQVVDQATFAQFM